MHRSEECRALAAKVLDKIRREPESHNQLVWATIDSMEASASKSVRVIDGVGYPVACGTTACVAGWASMLSGDLGVLADTRQPLGKPLQFQIGHVVTPDGKFESVERRGQELLCLDFYEKEWLFSAHRSRDEVLFALEEIVAGKSEISERTTFTYEESRRLESPPERAPEPRKTRVVRVAAQRVANADKEAVRA